MKQDRKTSKNDKGIPRIAGLIIANAMIFQEVLADYEAQVQHLRETLQSPDVVSGFANHWNFIVDNINYHPIFFVGQQLLIGVPSNPDVDVAVRNLAEKALAIVRERAALRHDLMGRVYHRLLAEAKYLGAYYTSIPAATLLLKVALNPKRWRIDWHDLGQVSKLKVSDLACGTGTLLMATAEVITDNYIHACGSRRIKPMLGVLSKSLIEEIIYGYDVQLSALHLTASTLALRSPEVTFRLMHLWSLPLGGLHHRLGSIEFLKDFHVPITVDLFGASVAPDQVSGGGDLRRQFASIPDLDVCVMNPPFTRSVGGNLLFGSIPEKERKPMQKELARLLKIPRVHANSTAGLGSVFVATGDLHLKKGGLMLLVLPKALLSGVAWNETRHLFCLKYQLENLIVSHDPTRWNFSENTDLSEVLVIASKIEDVEHKKRIVNGNVVCLNLWKNPKTAIEALSVAHTLMNGDAPDLEKGQGALDIIIGSEKFGEAFSIPWNEILNVPWILPCAFAQSDLARVAYHLMKGKLWMPGKGIVAGLPFNQLKNLGSLGPDRRDIHDGFKLSATKTSYPAFWGHSAKAVTKFSQLPNKYLSPLSKAKADRHLRKVEHLWPKAGNILLAERLGFSTARIVAVRMNGKVLSNVWWPFNINNCTDEMEKTLVLWLNSTLGLIILLANREETHGPWIDFKKPTLAELSVLDVMNLKPDVLKNLSDKYDELCNSEVWPLSNMASDSIREEIDKAISSNLKLPDLSNIRHMVAIEPIVCEKPLT